MKVPVRVNAIIRNRYVLTDDSLPEILRELLDTHRMTQREACEKAGIHPNALTRCVSGHGSLSLRSLVYLLEVFGKELIIVDKK